MAAIIHKFNDETNDFDEIAVVIDGEIIGHEGAKNALSHVDLTDEEALVDEYNSRNFRATHRPDDEVDVDSFQS